MGTEILAFLVTGLGIVLCVSLIAIVMLGKRIDSDAAGPQELEFKGLRAKTNVIIMFLIVSLVPAVLPLYLRSERAGQDALPGVTMYEKWTVRGQIVADDADDSTALIQPAQTSMHINADGTFSSDIPVMRSTDGKLHYPIFIIEHPAYRSENLDLGGMTQGGAFGGRDFQAKFDGEQKAITLQKPIKLVQRLRKPVALGAATTTGGSR
jgi:hypothetical protein